jgi:hypothetical protein
MLADFRAQEVGQRANEPDDREPDETQVEETNAATAF